MLTRLSFHFRLSLFSFAARAKFARNMDIYLVGFVTTLNFNLFHCSLKSVILNNKRRGIEIEMVCICGYFLLRFCL
jgi:hypothetical protein